MIRIYFISIIGAFLVSLIVTPISAALARRFGAMDLLSSRKIHSKVKPRWGGIGIVAGILVALLILRLMVPSFFELLEFQHGVKRGDTVLFTLNLGEQLAGIILGVLVIFIMGLVDDRKPIKPGMKFLIQILAAYIAMTYGVKIYGLSIPGFEAYSFFPLWIMQIVTILWLVGLTNAVNLIDGLDGLAGGVVAIVAGAFLSVVLIQNQNLSPMYGNQMKLAGIIAAALLGGVLGFLVYNFHPAQVFMGDSGSLSLGFLLGCMAVIGTFKTTILAVLFVPILLVVIPIADMTLAFGRRLIKRKNPFSADRHHLHHLLLDSGWTQREVVFLVYVITLIMALISITVVGVKN
ncbi:hypothetical protein BVX98_07915 [bacterium F11]|nr:hypothetical protein BVX98_07915 [bacterium F11]